MSKIGPKKQEEKVEKTHEQTLFPEDVLPPIQRDGCIVVAVTSTYFNAGTTTLVYNLTRELQQQRREDRLKVLVLDPTFSGDLSRLLNIPPNPYKGLNQLLDLVNDEIAFGNIWCDVDFKPHVTKLGNHVDLLPSFPRGPAFVYESWRVRMPGFDGMPALIRELRNHYDLILMDVAPSNYAYANLPLLSVCNYVVTPYLLGSIIDPTEALLGTDRIVMRLKAVGRPIEFGGIVPMFYLPSHRDHRKTLKLLLEDFEDFLWPVTQDKDGKKKTKGKILDQGIRVGYEEVLEELLKLKGKWPRRIVSKATKKSAIKIIRMIDFAYQGLSYEEIARELGLTRDQVISILRRISIFRNRGFEYCMQIYAQARRARRKDFSEMRATMADAFEAMDRREQEEINE